MPVGVLISTETGSGPVSLKNLSLTGPFQDFNQFVEDWNNVLTKWLPNGCCCILVWTYLHIQSLDFGLRIYSESCCGVF